MLYFFIDSLCFIIKRAISQFMTGHFETYLAPVKLYCKAADFIVYEESKMEIMSCQEAYRLMCHLTEGQKTVRNLHLDIRLNPWLVETELFPQEALEAYSAWNLELAIPANMREKYFSAHRGGSQGDYRDGMRAKIDNVVDCLQNYPQSKRAVITIPNEANPSHKDDAAAKCLREIHFYLEGNTVGATALFRAQAAEIFPKNIHFIGEMVAEVAKRLGEQMRPGRLHYLATTLVADRW